MPASPNSTLRHSLISSAVRAVFQMRSSSTLASQAEFVPLDENTRSPKPPTPLNLLEVMLAFSVPFT